MDPASTTRAIESDRLEEAKRFARGAHEGQVRKQNGHPFIEHPVAVEGLLAERGFDGDLLVAAYLHDTVEKTEVEIGEIERRFGPGVTAIVAAMSEDPAIDDYAKRKRALRSQAIEGGRDSTLLYAADRLCNLRDWRDLSPEDRHGAAERLGTTLEQRIQLWGEDVEALHDLDRDLPFLEEVEVELRALGADRA